MNNQALPWTPDFESYAVDHALETATVHDDVVCLRWSDGRESHHHAFWLRENSPDPETIHPLSREMLLDPLDIPSDIAPADARLRKDGALEVEWINGGPVSTYHPGWLRAHAFFDDAACDATNGSKQIWDSTSLQEPPTFHGPTALADPSVYVQWLEALRDFGVARLEGLPVAGTTLEEVVGRIGTIRESNFGRTFDVVVKNDPDSNAYTPAALVQHMDLATRELPPGLQFLFCRENSTVGGEGVFTDGFRVAADMQREEVEHFEALRTIPWEFKNRARESDYRAIGPVFAYDAGGEITEVRYTPWLRAPLKAPADVQRRAYTAVRAFMERNRDPAYQIRLMYRPGDLLTFDNRRVMHGRASYDAEGGMRHLHGCYMDRDELLSRIRTLRRLSDEK